MKPTRGSLTTRLGRLEEWVAQSPPLDHPRDEEGLLAVFEYWGAEGDFDREPDFPRALAECRDAIARARAAADPPFEPPVEFLPGHPFPHVRLARWRTRERFPEVHAALDWLGEMLDRLMDGIPPVSEREFAELVAWLAEHDAALGVLAGSTELLDVGNGRQVWCAHLRERLARGPRAQGAGRVAEDVRQLQARYGNRLR